MNRLKNKTYVVKTEAIFLALVIIEILSCDTLIEFVEILHCSAAHRSFKVATHFIQINTLQIL